MCKKLTEKEIEKAVLWIFNIFSKMYSKFKSNQILITEWKQALILKKVKREGILKAMEWLKSGENKSYEFVNPNIYQFIRIMERNPHFETIKTNSKTLDRESDYRHYLAYQVEKKLPFIDQDKLSQLIDDFYEDIKKNDSRIKLFYQKYGYLNPIVMDKFSIYFFKNLPEMAKDILSYEEFLNEGK